MKNTVHFLGLVGRRVIMAAVLVLFCSAQVFAWSEAINENVLVFDDQGEIQSSYHLGNWTSQVTEIPPVVSLQLWNPGSPPVPAGTDAVEIPLPASQTAVPNMTNGASSAPLAGVPNVSLYSFDTAIFPTRNPGTVPGIAASPSSGTYNHTIAVEIHAYAASGTPTIEIMSGGSWLPCNSNPYTLYVFKNTTINLRAVNGTAYSPVTILDYTITQPYTIDSDGDGFPDAWEVTHGLNPLSPGTGFVDANGGDIQDSDGDGMSDLDELIRGSNPNDILSLPVDTDGDGWSDWDEARRGTSPDNINIKPVASRLYEVEAKSIWGNAQGVAGPYPLGNPYTFTTLIGQQRYTGAISTYGNFLTSRIPLGDELIFRAEDQDVPEVIVKKYLASIADPTPADMADTSWTTPEEWLAAWENYLFTHLVIHISDFNVVPVDTAPLALLARQLEILDGIVPQAVPDMADQEAYYSFSEFGHQPGQGSVEGLREYLNSGGSSSVRNINQLMEDINSILANSTCTSFASDLVSLYFSLVDAPVTKEAAFLAKGGTGTYLAGLALQYSYPDLVAALDGQSFAVCDILDPLYDLDADGLANGAETPSPNTPNGLSELFVADSDSDGLADSADNCPRAANPGQFDLDGDGLGDACDPDIDNDGLENGLELAFGSSPYLVDTDNDGVSDTLEWQQKSDPGIGVLGVAGLFPALVNTSGGTEVSLYGSGFGAVQGTGSVTMDGLSATIVSWNETIITCLAPAHAAGVVDVVLTIDSGGILTLPASLTYVADSDGDGVPDASDICPGFDDNLDSDGDTIPDGCDLCAGNNASGDTDSDGTCDDTDLDDDNDGIADPNDPNRTDPAICGDSDNDMCEDCSVGVDGLGPLPDADPANDGPDADIDGICDAGDICAGFADTADTDSDGIPDGCDICAGFSDTAHSDGDGIPDGCDLCPDFMPIRLMGGSDSAQGVQWLYDLQSASPMMVKVQSGFVDGPLNLDKAIAVIIQGGLTCAFTGDSGGTTTIQSLTIGGASGAVTIDNIEIK